MSKSVKSKQQTKNQTKNLTKKQDVDFENFNWVKDDSNGQSWDFDAHPEFIGKYIRSEKRKAKKKGEPDYYVNIFKDASGNETPLPDNYAIKEAIKKHGECYYKIIFLTKKKTAGKKNVRVFEIYTSS